MRSVVRRGDADRASAYPPRWIGFVDDLARERQGGRVFGRPSQQLESAVWSASWQARGSELLRTRLPPAGHEETIRGLAGQFGRGHLGPGGDDDEQDRQRDHVPEAAEVCAEAAESFAQVARLDGFLIEHIAEATGTVHHSVTLLRLLDSCATVASYKFQHRSVLLPLGRRACPAPRPRLYPAPGSCRR